MSAKRRMTELEEIYGIPMKQKLREEVGHMCTYSAAIRERAEEEGREEERERIHNLYKRLKAENRMDDLMKAVDDMDYQNHLLKEYGL